MNASVPTGPKLDAEGYLVEPEDWDDALAAELATAQGIKLNDDHWLVIRFMRAYYLEHRVCADARHAMKHLEQRYPGEGRKQLFVLFLWAPARTC